ncbi:carbohydrate ABC transporter permease [Parasphaerochaeta coccoides]|uniref:Carbohydrate ABC transporter membrane protein 1, CUT1 family n=1 Tax=Parasphaerochaeta coccoides (strain ATCC BAA-1237 / DSM 17374 / SPN1) TaxID=760011 RepID=F4GKT2_PARC1|nr:sugar ABC transporter permease [Parasphaerochaeta coccoides]AEC01491.1 carbohydrate ABC transporter membrane protein 1, CUT1 family [Parasphaerochaeta coccoides DSM 17374]
MKKNRTMIVVFLVPAVFCYLAVFLYPSIRTFVMSFFFVEGVTDSVSSWGFAGLGNYRKIFTTPIFLQSMKNIGRIWFIGGAGTMLLSLVFAIALTSGMKFVKFFRSVIYLPNVVSAVAMGTMWINYVYHSDYGLLHGFFGSIGMTRLSQTLWTGPDMLFWSMLIAYCFGMVGYHMLIFMSGIEQIPRDYHEAAVIEGANLVQRFLYVTFPFLKGSIRTNLVMWTVSTVGFFVWAQLFSPVNLSHGTVAPMNYMYELVFGSSSSSATARDSGAGAAIGVTMMLIVVIVFFLTHRIVKNDDAEM